jgi:hypothetical protein
MTNLIERLEASEGADRELDKQIWQLLVPGVTRRTSHVAHHSKPYDIDETRDASGRLIIVPSYTTSIDAALALVEAVLPGYDWARTVEFKTMRLYVPSEDLPHYDGRHKSPAIALLIALLSAHEGAE